MPPPNESLFRPTGVSLKGCSARGVTQCSSVIHTDTHLIFSKYTKLYYTVHYTCIFVQLKIVEKFSKKFFNWTKFSKRNFWHFLIVLPYWNYACIQRCKGKITRVTHYTFEKNFYTFSKIVFTGRIKIFTPWDGGNPSNF